MRSREIDSGADIARACAYRDQPWMAVERTIPEPARCVVAVVAGEQHLSAQTRSELLDVGGANRDRVARQCLRHHVGGIGAKCPARAERHGERGSNGPANEVSAL